MHYLQNDELNAAVVAWQADPSAAGGDRLARLFYRLAEHFLWAHCPERDDVVQEAVLLCFRSSATFDPRRGHAFTYFTQAVRYAASTFRTRRRRQTRRLVLATDLPIDLEGDRWSGADPRSLQGP